MSRETKQALDEALQAHIHSECDGSMLSGYALQASYFDAGTLERGSTGYFREFADAQPHHAAYGLARMLADYFAAPEYLDDEDD